MEARLDPHRLADFLREPRETLDVELKRWLDLRDRTVQATLSRHLMALANHGGGWIHFGLVEREDGQFQHQEEPCPDRSAYSADALNAVVRRYADPPFHCEVFWQKCSAGCPGPHALVRVPGGHRIPVVCKRNGPEPDPDPRRGVVYGRLAGPRSEGIVEPDDWHGLLERCMRQRRDELVDTIRGAVDLMGVTELRGALAPEDSVRREGPSEELLAFDAASKARLDELLSEVDPDENPYEHGWWSVAYSIDPRPDPALRLPTLRRLLQEAVGQETGWPPWRWPAARDGRAPRVEGETIECWMRGGFFDDPSHSDYWRASTRAQFYLLRGFDEDAAAQLSLSHSHIAPGSVLDPVLPIWRVGECLLHMERVGAKLGAKHIHVIVRWTGLQGRHPASLDRRRWWESSREATSDSVGGRLSVDTGAISGTLPEIVHRLTEPLFVLFDFLEIPMDLVETELDRLRGRSPDVASG